MLGHEAERLPANVGSGSAVTKVQVSASTLDEMTLLGARGLDVELIDSTPRATLSDDRQQLVDRAIHERAHLPGFAEWLFDRATHPSGHTWRGVSRRAIALHTLYNIGRIKQPAEGIDPHIFDEPLFGSSTLSARQLVRREQQPERAVRTIARYDAFLDGIPLADSRDDYGLMSRDYLLGAADSHAVRSRADAAKSLAHEHLAKQFDGRPTRPLRIASLACGLAQPMLELAVELTERGYEVDDLTYVDHDPMALAMARSLSRGATVLPSVRTVRRNFLVQPLAELAGPDGFDVVDLVGMFEHLPTSSGGYRVAAAVLADAADAVRPGGLILIGNMLRDRPQQAFFDNVWPALQQRTIRAMLGLISDAGLSSVQTRVRIPAREGIYGVYGVTVPERRGRAVRDEPMQRLRAGLLRKKLPAY